MAEPKRRLKNIDVFYVSLVNKGANQKNIIYKSQEANSEPSLSKEIPIKKVDKDKYMVYGIVYSPEETDSQGDIASALEIEKAAYAFMKNARVNRVDKQHNEEIGEGYIAESWITRENDALFPDDPIGSWAVAIKIEKSETWDQIKNGKITGLSFMGVSEFEETSKVWKFFKSLFGAKKNFEDKVEIQAMKQFAWNLVDAFSMSVNEIFSEKFTGDKKAELLKLADEMKVYIDNNVDTVTKAGKVISTQNEKTIRDAIKALQSLLKLNTVIKEENEMEKDEIQVLIDESITKALDELKNDAVDLDEIKKTISDSITEALKPILETQKDHNEKLEKFEKSAGTNQQDGQEFSDIPPEELERDEKGEVLKNEDGTPKRKSYIFV